MFTQTSPLRNQALYIYIYKCESFQLLTLGEQLTDMWIRTTAHIQAQFSICLHLVEKGDILSFSGIEKATCRNFDQHCGLYTGTFLNLP